MAEIRVRNSMSEADFQRAVLSLARWLGLLDWHDNDSRRNSAGLPDLILVGPRGVLWRELKTATGKLRPAQQTWGTALGIAGQDWDVWRPADLRSGRVKQEMEAIR